VKKKLPLREKYFLLKGKFAGTWLLICRYFFSKMYIHFALFPMTSKIERYMNHSSKIYELFVKDI